MSTSPPDHEATHSRDGVRHTLEIVVPATTMSERVERVARAYRGQARLPGFRKGKAPLSMVRQRFGDEIQERVVDDAIPEFLSRELQERELEPLGSPRLETVHFRPGEPLRFTVAFDTAPDVEVEGWEGLSARRRQPEVTDEMIDDALGEMRERGARLLPADDEEIGPGHFVRCRIALLPKDGKGKRLAEEDRYVKVGDERAIPGLNDQLEGLRVGDEREFVTRLSEQYPNDILAGKDVRCRVEVTEVKRRHLPDIDDELARDLGFEDLETLRGQVAEDISGNLQERARHDVDDQLLEQLREKNPVEVPPSLVERRLEQMIQRVARDLDRQGIDPEEALDWRSFRQEHRAGAEESLAEELLLDAVADELEIEVEDTVVQGRVKEQLDKSEGGKRRPFPAVVQQMRKDGSFEALRATLRRRSALDAIRQRATIESDSGARDISESGADEPRSS